MSLQALLGDSGFEDYLSELTVPETCTHGFAERALDVGEDGFSHPPLVVVVVFRSLPSLLLTLKSRLSTSI